MATPRYEIERIGLTSAEHTGPTGEQGTVVFALTPGDGSDGAGVVGTSQRYVTGSTYGGTSAWYWDGSLTRQIGLIGPEFTNAYGERFSGIGMVTPTGAVLGYSHVFRAPAVSTVGNAIWVFEPSAGTTTRLGYFGAAHTSANGNVQTTVPLTSARQLVGQSARYGAVEIIGMDCFVYRDGQQRQIGLVGGEYTATDGNQLSSVFRQDDADTVSGWSKRYQGLSGDLGQDAWVWNQATGTVRIGLTGTPYQASNGYRYSFPRAHSATGVISGATQRFTSANSNNGTDAWVWRGSAAEVVGLVGTGYEGTTGYRYSDAPLLNSSGAVAGISYRITDVNNGKGQDAWVSNGQTARLIGLTGGAHEGSTGYRDGRVVAIADSGQVAGAAYRFLNVMTENGRSAWVWDPTMQQTVTVGLTTAAYTGTAGYQLTVFTFTTNSGYLGGSSYLITGVNTQNGRLPWVWDPTTRQMYEIGLTGQVYTGSAGFRQSVANRWNEAGFVLGTTYPIVGVNELSGRHAWVWNPTTRQTVRVGLTGAVHTGSAGYQYSDGQHLNAAGVVAGESTRFAGSGGSNGYDAWYFDPATGVTTALVGSVRASDGRAQSRVMLLREDGVASGIFTRYGNGQGEDEQRAFLYSPTLGFVDVGTLVEGGLSASGWSVLSSVVGANGLATLAGHGRMTGQTAASQSGFAMVELPPCPADFNGDEVVDLFDYLDFVGAFAGEEPGSDFNADTITDFFDYLDFVAAFSNGC